MDEKKPGNPTNFTRWMKVVLVRLVTIGGGFNRTLGHKRAILEGFFFSTSLMNQTIFFLFICFFRPFCNRG